MIFNVYRNTIVAAFLVMFTQPVIAKELCVEGACFGDSLSQVKRVLANKDQGRSKRTTKDMNGDVTLSFAWRKINSTQLNCYYNFNKDKLTSITFEGFANEEQSRHVIERKFTGLFGKPISATPKTLGGGGIGKIKSSFEGSDLNWKKDGFKANLMYFSPSSRKYLVRGTIERN